MQQARLSETAGERRWTPIYFGSIRVNRRASAVPFGV